MLILLKSLKNLNVKTIDLIQPHWPNYDVNNDEIIKAFNYLKKNKKARFFGLSNYDLKDINTLKKLKGFLNLYKMNFRYEIEV